MIKKKKVFYSLLAVLLLTSLYFYSMGNHNSEKVTPENTVENIPPVENAMPSKEDDSSTMVQNRPQVSPASSHRMEIERSSSLVPNHEESVNLEEQSYSIKNEKKEIPITPGVSLQPGKSVNVKIPGGEEVIRIQRDKTYHPGGYNVLWEKKY